MLKPLLKNLLAKIGFLMVLDQIRRQVQGIVNYRKNIAFQKQNPEFILPDNKILYETFRLDYSKYYSSGKEAAQWLLEQYHRVSKQPLSSILDWGCGPARIIRHLPDMVAKKDCEIWGSDFNPDTINWCQKNISGVEFITNSINPPIDFTSNKFSFIYAISVFTHLAGERHRPWFEELHRLLKPAGVLLFTTQGFSYCNDLTFGEKNLFEKGEIVVRQNHEEGRRIFSAYHPPDYIRDVTESLFDVISHEIPSTTDRQPKQDIWLVKKK